MDHGVVLTRKLSGLSVTEKKSSEDNEVGEPQPGSGSCVPSASRAMKAAPMVPGSSLKVAKGLLCYLTFQGRFCQSLRPL